MTNETEKKNKRKMVYIAVGIVILIVILIAGGNSGNQKLNSLLDLGQKYFDNMQYEEAVAVFDQAIAIEPKCEQAYLGKAKAQHALGQNEQAMETLILAMEQVEDTSQLEILLQEIQDIVEKENGEENTAIEIGVNKETIEVVPERIKTGPFILNYSSIVRFTNTEQPTIQLEILGEENENLNLTWSSSNEEYASVSEDGLVTCKEEEGYTSIEVIDENTNRRGRCGIQIVEPGYTVESETICFEMEEDEEQYIAVRVENNENDTTGTIELPERYWEYVYYSGNVEIPEHLTYAGKDIQIKEISSGAFYACEELATVMIPASVEKIGSDSTYNPFIDCIHLTEIIVDERNEFYKSEDGVLYSKDGKTLLAYPAEKKDKTYTIPKGVEEIYTGAFAGCKSLEEICVEEGNKRYISREGVLIDENEETLLAYPAGKKNSEYQIPQGIKVIESEAFKRNELKTVEFSPEVTNICWSAFVSCNNLEKVLGMVNVENIFEDIFINCPKLKEIEGGVGTKRVEIGFYSYSGSNETVIKRLENMVNLEELSVSTSAITDIQEMNALTKLKTLQINEDKNQIDFTVIEKLHNLEHVYLENVNELNDLLWVKDLDKLEKLNIYVENFNVTDLSPLFDLDVSNLNHIRIERSVWDGNEKIMDENMLQQIEELKFLNPNLNISIMGN